MQVKADKAIESRKREEERMMNTDARKKREKSAFC